MCVYISVHTHVLILSKICHGNRQGIVYPIFSVSLNETPEEIFFRTKCQKKFPFPSLSTSWTIKLKKQFPKESEAGKSTMSVPVERGGI